MDNKKEVTDVYVHLLKAHASNRIPTKRLIEKFYPMDLFSEICGKCKNLVLSYSQSRISLN